MNTSSLPKIKVKGDDLRKVNIISYGIGHFLNDLCAGCWFFFLSYYLVEIIQIGEYNAGYVMLAGQVADGISTPLVGIFSDKTNTRCGKRTPWYVTGTLLVVVSFVLIFYKIIPEDASDGTVLIYYIIFPSLFNIGWAAVQVSHMALLPSLTLNKKNKDKMIRIRTGFTFLAQTAVLLMSLLFFWLVKDKIVQYEILAFSCVGIGIATSIVFLIFCSENRLSKNIPLYLEDMRTSLNNNNKQENEVKTEEQNEDNGTTESNGVNEQNQEVINWIYWMKKPDFYAYMIVYMFCRLCINITQSFIPFYMQNILGFALTESGGTPVEIVIVLLVSTFGSIVNSMFLQSELEKKFSNPKKKRLVFLLISTIFVLIGCLPMYFLNDKFTWPIYGLAFFFGIGFSMGLSVVSCSINDVVGSKGAQGAFVYGAYSFADKLSCGIVLAVFLPLVKHNSNVLKYSMPIFPPLSLFAALIIVYSRGKCLEQPAKQADCADQLIEQNDRAQKKGGASIIDNSRFTFINDETQKRREEGK